MDPYGKFTEPGVIKFERLLPAPIDTVWAYLTEPEKRGKWLAAGEMDLRVGGKVQLDFDHAILSPHKDPIPSKYKDYETGHSLYGIITQCDPPDILSYTWGETDGAASEVTFELFPKKDGTLLVLTHRRLGSDRSLLISVAGGWHTHLGILVDHLHGRTPKGFWSVHSQVEREYEKHLS